MDHPAVIVLMGVSGSGKTTVGIRLAAELGCPFYDADDFHSKENIAKMAQGVPLTDQDREPWLRALRGLLEGILAKGGRAVLACSLLRQAYRDTVLGNLSGIRLVYLKCDYALLEKRLRLRKEHFFKAALLASQFAILEEPKDALVLPVPEDATPEALSASIRNYLFSSP